MFSKKIRVPIPNAFFFYACGAVPVNNAEVSKDDHSKRIKKLQEIREKLIAGEEVANRQLRTWLGEYFKDVAQEWACEQDMRLKPQDKPDAIREYERRLKRAHFQYAKACKALSKGSPSKTKQFNQTDTAYERVLEYLQEQVSIDPTLEQWLDRTTDNGPETVGTGIDFHSMPRVRTSRSKENQSAASMIGYVRTKRDIKIEVVDRAIEALTAEPTDSPDAEQQAKLQDMLRALRSR